MQSCQHLFLVESIAYKIGAGPVQSCQQSLSGGEHCLQDCTGLHQSGKQCSPPERDVDSLVNLSFWWRALLTRLVRSCAVLSTLFLVESIAYQIEHCASLVNRSFWWRALLTDWCGPVQSCQPLFLVESIAYQIGAVLCSLVNRTSLVESIAYQIGATCAVLSTNLSGGEHCLPIGAVLCSLVNLSFWWRALLTDWCGPVQSCQHLFLVESIDLLGAVLCSLVNLSFWWRALLTDWCGPVQSCQPLFLVESIAYQIGAVLCTTSLSGGEHCLPIGAVLCSLVNLSFWWRALLTRLVRSCAVLSTSLSGGEHCLPIGASPVQSCQHLFLVESIAYRLVRSCAVLSTSLSGGEHYLPIGAVLCSLVNLSFWWRALLTDWCGPVQSCQPLFLVESIAYRLVQDCTVLVQKERLSTSLSGGEHCLQIGAVLCSLVNLSFWWRALLTDWCGPVQSCQPLFLVESIAYRLVRSCAVLSTSLSGGEHCLPDWLTDCTGHAVNPVSQPLFLVESIAYRLVRSCAVLSTSLSGGEHCLQIGAVLSTSLSGGEHCLPDWCGCAVLSTSLSGGEHCLQIGAVLCSLVNLSFWWRALLTDWCGPVQSCQPLFLVESIAYRLVRSCALVNISFWWRALLTDWCGPVQSCQHLFLVESMIGAVLHQSCK